MTPRDPPGNFEATTALPFGRTSCCDQRLDFGNALRDFVSASTCLHVQPKQELSVCDARRVHERETRRTPSCGESKPRPHNERRRSWQ